MAGGSAALQAPTIQSSSTMAHRQVAHCQPEISSVYKLCTSNHQRQILLPRRTHAPSASVRALRIFNSSRILQHKNFYRFGFSLAASSDDWVSIKTKSSEADAAEKDWANHESDVSESGDQDQAGPNKDTFETTTESGKGATTTQDGSSELSRKFMEALRVSSEVIKEQAKKAGAALAAALAATAQKTAAVLAATAQKTAEKNKEKLSYIAENAPDPIREIADTALKAHSAATLEKFAEIHDFCLGIPYGTMLVIGGLLLFIISGSTAPIRFGIMLGGILLALSVTSLSAWKDGKPTSTYIIGQGVISAILALRQIRRLWESMVYLFCEKVYIAGMLGFYCYVLLAGGNPRPKETKQTSAV